MTTKAQRSQPPQISDGTNVKGELIEAERILCKGSMRRFVKYGFHTVEQSTPYKDNWHVHAICDHLEAVANGGIRKLAISMPPRHLKSILVSVMWLAWIWSWKPSWRAMHSSYSEKLSLRDSIKARRLIESEWYKERFSTPDNWAIRTDQNTQDAFSTTAGGHRLALSVGGRAIGEGAHCVVSDDPQNLDGVYSKSDRERTQRWWLEVMPSRVDDPQHASFVIVQQRLHPEDLIGIVLARELGYETLCLPSEFVPDRKFITYKTDATTGLKVKFWEDPRTKEGELLFPQAYDEAELEDRKKTMGARAYAAQHQQDPVATADSMFKPSYWRFWKPPGRAASGAMKRPAGCRSSEDAPSVPLPEKFDRIVIAVDCTLLGEQATDWTVIQAWASLGADRFLLEQKRGKYGVGKTCEILREMSPRFPFARILIEEAVVGPAVVEELQRKVSNVHGVKPIGKKEARAAVVVGQAEAGNCFLPEGADWLDVYVTELAAFPQGRHDDQVDPTTLALVTLESSAAVGMPVLTARVELWPGRGIGQAPRPIMGGPPGSRGHMTEALRRRFR